MVRGAHSAVLDSSRSSTDSEKRPRLWESRAEAPVRPLLLPGLAAAQYVWRGKLSVSQRGASPGERSIPGGPEPLPWDPGAPWGPSSARWAQWWWRPCPSPPLWVPPQAHLLTILFQRCQASVVESWSGGSS